MTKDQILSKLKEQGLDDVIQLIEDAEHGDLEELELVETVGLLYDESLNQEVLKLLDSLGVTITYVYDDEEDNEEDE